MNQQELYSEMAKYEIGWWKAHHRKDKEGMIHNMAELQALQSSSNMRYISYEEARKAVVKKMEATKEHDLAELLEDKGKQKEADKHWKKAERLLAKHFSLLYI